MVSEKFGSFETSERNREMRPKATEPTSFRVDSRPEGRTRPPQTILLPNFIGRQTVRIGRRAIGADAFDNS